MSLSRVSHLVGLLAWGLCPTSTAKVGAPPGPTNQSGVHTPQRTQRTPQASVCSTQPQYSVPGDEPGDGAKCASPTQQMPVQV